MKILVVDDQPAIREVLSVMLGFRNHAVIEASDVSHGFEKFMAHKDDIQLVITDLSMESGSRAGLVLIRRIREISNVKIILMSGSLNDEIIAIAHNFDVHHFLSKPFIGLKDIDSVLKGQ